MAKQKDIRGLLQKQIEDLTKKLAVSRASLVYYQSVVGQQEEELRKLENALASLDGAPVVLPAKYEDLEDYNGPRGNLVRIRKPNSAFAAPSQAPSVTVKIGDEDVIVEPGFHVEKNSFGEDCIVPDGLAHAPAAEPAATPDTSALFKGAGIPLPAITSGDTFDSPEDMIYNELPLKREE